MSPSFTASGTLKSVLSLCLALSTITPILAAPTSSETSSPWVPRSLKSLFEPRAPTCNGQVGVLLTNNGATKSFSFWTNVVYTRTKLKDVTVDSGTTQFVPLDNGWSGTVQRGDALPATWVEMNMAGTAWGDVSLQQGCDGGATLSSTTDGTSQGFTTNINKNTGIPAAAFFNPSTQGSPCYGTGQCTTEATDVLDTTTGNWWAPKAANTASANYIYSQLGGETAALQKAFIGTADSNTTPQVTSSNNCFAVTFY